MAIKTSDSVQLLRVMLCGVLGAWSGLGYGPVFGGVPGPGRFVLAVVVAAGVATLVAGGALIWPRLPTVLVAMAGSVAVVAAATVVAQPGWQLADGPWLLLTGALPAEPNGSGLAAVAVLTGWVTLAAGLFAVFGANPLFSLLPVAVNLIGALGVGASCPALPGWYAPSLILLVAGVLAIARLERLRPTLLSAAVAVAGLAVLVTAGLGSAAPGASRRAPADARQLVEPVTPLTGVSPLQQYLALRDRHQPIRLEGRVSQKVGPGRLRMVTLTAFDGSYWTVDAKYRRAGSVLPAPPPSRARKVRITQDIRMLVRGPLAWLPTAGRAGQITIRDLGVDESTGDLVLPADQSMPDAYSATSYEIDVRADQIQAAHPVTITPPPELELLPLSRAFAEHVRVNYATGSATLLGLEQEFTRPHTKFAYDEGAEVPGGHGLRQIEQLMETKHGTSEQYASAYAVLARYLGYDARVVMGFRPEYASDDPRSFTVAGRNVDAWVEVNLKGMGWVVIDPSPRTNTVNTRDDIPPRSTPEPTSAPSSATNSQEEDEQEITPPPPSSGLSLWNVLLALAASLAGLVLVALVAIPLTKLVRRRRRRHDSPRLSVLGAWWETLDRLHEAGLPTSASNTTSDVLSMAALRRILNTPKAFGSLSALADVVDRAGYAPEEPTPALSTTVWKLATDFRNNLFHAMPVARRIISIVDPRPLMLSKRRPR